MITDIFQEIGSTLRNNKLRTALTGFAVSWGIFLLICLLGAGNGLMNSFMGNMEDFISQSVNVEGWYTSEPYAGYQAHRRIELDEGDVAYTQGKDWEGVIYNVTRSTQGRSEVLAYASRTVDGYMTGATPEYQDKEKIKLTAGRFINKADLQERRKVIVISRAQAKELMPSAPEEIVGRWINASSVAFLVVGVYQTDERDWRRSVLIPFSTYKGIYDSSDKVDAINFELSGPSNLKEHREFNDEYGAALRRRHDIAPTDERGIWLHSGYVENMQMNQAKNILRIALWILGILTLISGIVGVSNIMLISVKERTHEFGIRKAIGAKPKNILSLIIAESVTITASFGYVGMLLGMIACQVMDKTVGASEVDLGFQQIRMLVNPTVGVDVALEATLLLIVAGTVAGLAPALKAAKVRPIEALRAE
jgi:putative ABC transport system permease protein